MRNVHKIIEGTTKKKEPLVRTWRRIDDNIKLHHQKTRRECRNSIQLTQDNVQLLGLVNVQLALKIV
jgi:hypothetical protein